MSDKKCKVTVEIFGETYALKGDAEPAKIMELAQFLDSRMKRIAYGNPRLSPGKIAVLAALHIADEYLRLEKDYQHVMAMLKEGK